MNYKVHVKKRTNENKMIEASDPTVRSILKLYTLGQYDSAVILIDDLISGQKSKRKAHILMIIKALILMESKEYETATAMLREIADVRESSEGKDICQRALAYYNNCLANGK